MPRIRTIKPEFWSDEKLAPLDPVDRLAFLGLISMADDFGRVHDNVKVIDAFVFPECSRTVRESLAKLSRMGRIRRGKSSSGKAIIEIENWSKHQRVDKPQTATALPPIDEIEPDNVDETPENTGENDIREPVANDSRTVREPLATLSGIRDQGSGTVDQGSSTHTHSRENQNLIIPEDFADCWGLWCQFREAIDGKPPDDISAQMNLMELSRRGVDKATRDIEFSIRKNAKTILDSDNDFEKRSRGKSTTEKERVVF